MDTKAIPDVRDPNLAQFLFENGATLVFADPPREHLTFGIDLSAWQTGPRFNGVKMIPPGLHLFHTSCGGKQDTEGHRDAFLHIFSEREILPFKWSRETEEFLPEGEEQADRIRANMMNLDAFLGPYPYLETWRAWQATTSWITAELLVTVFGNAAGADGTSCIRLSEERGASFSQFDLKKSFPPDATPAMVTRYAMDKSYLLQTVLKSRYPANDRLLLGEVQLCFILFYLAHKYEGFEQWKQLVILICFADEFTIANRDFTVDFVEVLRRQLRECPTDFFYDTISSGNFLAPCMKRLAQNMNEIPGCSKVRAELIDVVQEKFGLDLSYESEDDEDAPVVMEGSAEVDED